MALSSEPVASVLESGDQATVDTPAMCPISVSTCFPVVTSQILMEPSAEAEAIHMPSGDMRAWEMGCLWPPRMSLGRKLGRRGWRWRGGEATATAASSRGVRNGVGSTDGGDREREMEGEGEERAGEGERDRVRERERERERELERERDRERDREGLGVLRSLEE